MESGSPRSPHSQGEDALAHPVRLTHSSAVERSAKLLLWCLVVLGVLALLYYGSWWWARPDRIVNPWLALLLALAALYGFAQLVGAWVLYLAARRPPHPDLPDPDLKVDVIVTVCGEPLWLVERSVAAACAMRGPHRTILADDGGDPSCAELAARLGAEYLTRSRREGQKAGNLNAALARTDGDVVAVFDVDHVPEPDLLERTLGAFRDPRVGFVQVMLSYSNRNQSWVAGAATESSYDFFNPTSMGADRLGAVSMHGSSAVLRRQALDSIGGYRPGLAEDLATSIALHAAGWRSVYVAEPLAPGLAPADLASWFVQQFKWSRGVFEVLVVDYPRLFRRLSWAQRLAYLVRMTYYWTGSAVAIHLFFMMALLLGGSRVARLDFQQYLLHILPLGLCALTIQQFALRFWRHPRTPARPLWRPILLVSASWPVYTLAWLMAITRVPLRFRPTPKALSGRVKFSWVLPQIFSLAVLLFGMLFATALSSEPCPRLLLPIGALQALPMVVLLWIALVGRPEGERHPERRSGFCDRVGTGFG